jgi:hypothetical protein
MSCSWASHGRIVNVHIVEPSVDGAGGVLTKRRGAALELLVEEGELAVRRRTM